MPRGSTPRPGDTATLEAIHRLLDGRQWRGGSDLLAIADVLRAAGFKIGRPGRPAGPRPALDPIPYPDKPTSVTVRSVDLQFLAEQRAWLDDVEVEHDAGAAYREGLIHMLDKMLEGGGRNA